MIINDRGLHKLLSIELRRCIQSDLDQLMDIDPQSRGAAQCEPRDQRRASSN